VHCTFRLIALMHDIHNMRAHTVVRD